MAKEKLFKTQFDAHERKFMNAGESVFPIRKARKVNGVLNVDDTKDMFNMKEYINSFKDSCDINILLKRFKAGDQDAIAQFTHSYGEYMDLAEIPDNFNDMMELARKGEDMFNSLPVEMKEKFNNNYEEFVGSVGTKEWMEKMGYDGKIEKPAEEVVSKTAGDPADNKE